MSNFKNWQHDIELGLGLMDMCLLEDKPIILTRDKTQVVKTQLHKWEKAN